MIDLEPESTAEEPQFKHGLWGYRKGCRCDDCKAANTAACGRYKLARLKKPVPEHVHGTIGGATNYNCPCQRCLDVMHVSHAAWRQKRREAASKLAENATAVNRRWTAKQDAQLLQARNLEVLAYQLRRTLCGVRWRLWKLTGSAVPGRIKPQLVVVEGRR